MSPNPNNQSPGREANLIEMSLERGKGGGGGDDEDDEEDGPDRTGPVAVKRGLHLGQSKSHTAFPRAAPEKKQSVSSLVDELLHDIYGKSGDVKRKSSSVTTTGDWSWHDSDTCRRRGGFGLRSRSNLKQMEVKFWSKDVKSIREEIAALESMVAEESNNLVKYLKRKDYLLMRREAHYDVITAVIQAISSKTRDDMRMKFSLSPGTETGFSQWLDAMKMVAQLPGGVPSEFRTKLWLQLSERHLNEQNIDWEKAEAVIFNEWTNPDDEELGVQIVKDLHRTGCSLFCGAQEQNQALLKRVLLAYARWNKNVGYCQGFNMLAALILQVMDRDEKNAVKVMIYLIEGVLPESYFANNLRGLSVDMAVFRDLLRLRLPKLSKHLEALQNDTNTGTSYEPPLTNVFTMQWFLTLFSNCLPQQTVLRVWDLVFLHGNEVLLRTALAIWGILQDRIITVESADEFYSIMGVVTREMLEFGLMDANNLIKMIVMVDPFPNELQELREKYLYNISPWTQSVQSAARKGIKLFYSDPEDQDDTEDEDKIALATAYGVFRRRESGSKEVQPMGPTLDISVLKQQYAKLRQRQRQAHIIISAACSSNLPTNLTSVPTVSVNHLLMGKSALVNKGRRIGPPEGSIPPPKSRASKAIDGAKQVGKREKVVISGETLEWKDAEKRKCSGSRISNTDSRVENNKLRAKSMETCNGLTKKSDGRQLQGKADLAGEENADDDDVHVRKRRSSTSSGSSTSTELCDDEIHRLSDFDSEETHSEAPALPGPVDGGSAPEVGLPGGGTRSDEEERREEARRLAADLVRGIEEELQRCERLRRLDRRHVSSGGNTRARTEAAEDGDATNSSSNHDNILIDKFPINGRGRVEEEFLKSEPEVPIFGKNVIDNAENRTFDRSKAEGVAGGGEGGKRDRDRRKSDLALSVIKENLEMLNKFTQKASVKEESPTAEGRPVANVNGHQAKTESEEDTKPFARSRAEKEANPVRREEEVTFWMDPRTENDGRMFVDTRREDDAKIPKNPRKEEETKILEMEVMRETRAGEEKNLVRGKEIEEDTEVAKDTRREALVETQREMDTEVPKNMGREVARASINPQREGDAKTPREPREGDERVVKDIPREADAKVLKEARRDDETWVRGDVQREAEAKSLTTDRREEKKKVEREEMSVRDVLREVDERVLQTERREDEKMTSQAREDTKVRVDRHREEGAKLVMEERREENLKLSREVKIEVEKTVDKETRREDDTNALGETRREEDAKMSKEVERDGEKVKNGRVDLLGEVPKDGRDEAAAQEPKPDQEAQSKDQNVSKVNKEVNTDITFAADLETSPRRRFDVMQKLEQSKADDFLISLMSSKSSQKSPERFKPERIGYRDGMEAEGGRPFGREDLAEKWKKESERIESKIEMSKSDWDLKMRKIAELENTTREKLNEIKSKSIGHRHRSLDRFEGRDRRRSPIPKIEVQGDGAAEEAERRKKRISALSFDEITSRTEKLLGTNLNLDSGQKRWRFEEDGAPGGRGQSYEFYSSPTSPEYRQRKYTEYSSPKRYDPKWKHPPAGEEEWLTITEENGRPRAVDLGRKPDGEHYVRSPTGFNPFPTRTLSRPKEVGVRLGMYPSSPEDAHQSKKS